MEPGNIFRNRPYLRLAVAWTLTCYVLTVGNIVYQLSTRGSIFYSYPAFDVLELVLSPLLVPGLLSDSIHNCLSGNLPLGRFLAIYAVVVPLFAFVFWATGRVGRRRAT